MIGRAISVLALCAVLPAAVAETIPVARDADGVVLTAACPEAPERALISGHPVPVPAPPRARLFRYRIDGAAPAVGTVEPHPDGVGLRFPNGAWLNGDLLAVALPGAWQRLTFALAPGAAARCGVAAPKAGERRLIAAVQSALAAHGLAPGRADGVFDTATGAAIRRYQAYFGMIVDGVPSPALRGHLAAHPPAGAGIDRLRALAARIERHWRPPGWARGAWSLTIPVGLRLDDDGMVVSASVADGDPRFARIARSAAEAALATGRLANGAALPRELVLHLTLPVGDMQRKYARKVAARLARHRAFAGLPPGAPGGRAAVMRLHIDGAAGTVRAELLDGGVLSPEAIDRIRAAAAHARRLPPVPMGEGPRVFVMDVTLFARAPYVLPGRVAFSDWPGD